MKNKGIKPVSRIILLLAAIALAAVLFTPMWRIDLNAPQYPEGLKLLIFASKLGGNVDIINGLNHYIGMKTLHTSDFIEFRLLPILIGVFIAAYALVALVGRRSWLYILFAGFVCFGIVAMIDFWRWEYNYGHNLNPDAAIIVPGMAYQPPLIGFKQLLNFGAYSIPDTGGWIFIGVGLATLLLVFFEWRQWKKMKKNIPVAFFALLGGSLVFSGCQSGPEPLQPGRDNCSFCKMTISDRRFGAEIVTKKGKVYKFDDALCMLSFAKAGSLEQKDIGAYYITNFSGNHELVNTQTALLLQTETLRGPMNGNLTAFTSEDSMKKIAGDYNGQAVSWQELLK
ncbi:MAG: nitrous oxide reductase accessory protein NosL [Ferruginibacter sp.]